MLSLTNARISLMWSGRVWPRHSFDISCHVLHYHCVLRLSPPSLCACTSPPRLLSTWHGMVSNLHCLCLLTFGWHMRSPYNGANYGRLGQQPPSSDQGSDTPRPVQFKNFPSAFSSAPITSVRPQRRASMPSYHPDGTELRLNGS